LVPQERPADSITLSIMINNKFIGTIIQEEGSELIDEEIYALLLEDPKFQGKLDQVTVKKIVHRRGKVFNILI